MLPPFPSGLRTIFATMLVVAAGASLARAQSPVWNPHPGSGDIVLSMPGAMKMVFVKVPVPGKGAYGGTERIFQLGGDKTAPTPFQHPRQMRIGPTFKEKDGAGYLLFGKYEVTIGQFAAMLGQGDLAKGLAQLAQISDIEQLTREGAKPEEYAADQRFLARALHGVAIDDLHEFIARYNSWCLVAPEGKACRDEMRSALGTPGYFRLPAEPEWEYVARGGATGARAQAVLPFPSAELQAYAHVASKRRQPDEIGKLKPHPALPIYDLFGNVSELMAGPFTLDNGTGAFGGAVARGGDFKSAEAIVRSSLREEVAPYIWRQATQAFVKRRAKEIGLRLTVGQLLRSTNEDPQADQRHAEEFRASYVPCCGVEGVADPYGNTLRTAKDIGALAIGKDVELNDTVGGADDPADFLRFMIGQYGTLRIIARAEEADVTVEYKHAAWESWRQTQVKAGRLAAIPLPGVMPGVVWVKLYPSNAQSIATWRLRLALSPSDCCGYSPETAKDLGEITGQVEIDDYVGAGDLTDFLKLKLARPGPLSLRLLELTGDADLELLDQTKKVIASSINPGAAVEQIDVPNAAAGEYYVRVFAKSENVQARYKLKIALGAVDTAGHNRETARDLGLLSSELINITEAVGGTDTADYFKIRLSQASILRVHVNRSEAPVTIALHDMRDQEISRGLPGLINPKLLEIATGRPAGTYYIVVRSATGASVPYTMTVEVRPAPEHGVPEMAKQVSVGPTPVEYRNSLTKEVQSRYVTFDLSSGGVFRIELQAMRADPGAGVDLLLFRQAGPNWQKVAEAPRGGAAPSVIERPLEPGRYIVALHWNRDSRGNSADVLLKVTQLQGGQPSQQASHQGSQGQGHSQLASQQVPGQVMRRHGAWTVSVLVKDQLRICYAFTDAVSADPAGWRSERPRLIIEVAQGQSGLFHAFDDARQYRSGAPLFASLKGRQGGSAIPLMESGGALKAVEPCPDDRTASCTIVRAMQSLNRADELSIQGTSRDGQRTTVVYSLVGYRDAVTHMNNECNSSRLTGWLEEGG